MLFFCNVKQEKFLSLLENITCFLARGGRVRKQKSRRYKRYIKKQIKKSLDERLFKKFNFNVNGLPNVELEKKSFTEFPRCNKEYGCSNLAMPKYLFNNVKCNKCDLKPNY